MNKSEIRKIYHQKRLGLSSSQVLFSSQKIAENVINNLITRIDSIADKKIAFYIATNNEVDLTAIIKKFSEMGNIIALPKISDSLVLDFKEYKLGDQLIKNNSYPKLLEPSSQNISIIPDIIFLPLVAFDNKLNRIGMGGGFYDATISYLQQQKYSPMLVGIGYEWQEYQQIPSEKLDQVLHFIVSENKIISRNQ